MRVDLASPQIIGAGRSETGDERYAWLSRTVFVARGRVVAGGLEYEVFRVG
jgi:hypothetical protein